MANIGQTIIIRTDIFDLPNDVGLISAQVAHIHFQGIRNKILTPRQDGDKIISFPTGNKVELSNMLAWIDEPYTYVKKVPNAEALNYFSNLAKDKELPVASWFDTVYIKMSPTQKKAFTDVLVGIAIGPEDSDKIRSVVGDLPLL